MGDHVRPSGGKTVENLFYRRYSNGTFVRLDCLANVLVFKRQEPC